MFYFSSNCFDFFFFNPQFDPISKQHPKCLLNPACYVIFFHIEVVVPFPRIFWHNRISDSFFFAKTYDTWPYVNDKRSYHLPYLQPKTNTPLFFFICSYQFHFWFYDASNPTSFWKSPMIYIVIFVCFKRCLIIEFIIPWYPCFPPQKLCVPQINPQNY